MLSPMIEETTIPAIPDAALCETRVISADGTECAKDDSLAIEHVLYVYVDGALAMRVVCSPSYARELIVGRLFTEGIIDSAADIARLELNDDLTEARVGLAASPQLEGTATPFVPTTGAGNKVLLSGRDRIVDPGPLESIEWKPEWIISLAKQFKTDSPMHQKTVGVHSCYLALADKVVYRCEDMGRHNAFDKVIGCALLDGFDLTRAIAFTSGRVPIDMVTKALRARIPVLVTKAVPTVSSLELAREHNLTLITSAHPDSFKLW